jgi:hypothetical protein
MLYEEFMDVLHHGWNILVQQHDKAKMVGANFRNLRRVLKCWHSKLSNLAATITSNKIMIFLLNSMDKFRDLYVEEWNFIKLV